MHRPASLLATVLPTAASATTAASILAVSKDDIVSLGGKGDGFRLFDEATLAGDPKAGKGGAPVTEYTNGSDSVDVWCGDGSAWTSIASTTTSGYQAWKGFSTICAGRYVRFRVKSPQAAITWSFTARPAVPGRRRPPPSQVRARRWGR